jgi:hypothetical protein
MLTQQDWDKVTPANVRETVKFDLLGQRKLQFTDEAVWYYTEDMMVVPLPTLIVSAMQVRNRPIAYEAITWVGPIRKRSWGALVLGVLGAALGLYMMATNLKNSGALGVAAGIFLAMGVVPLWMFYQGRKFLAIASEREVICFPMDRKKKQVQRSIALLKQSCPGPHVRWDVPVPASA